jgi:hypothetical protein
MASAIVLRVEVPMFRALFPTLILVLVAVPRAADACSCLLSSPCRTYASADAVFAGDVVDVADPNGRGPKVAHVRVARAYKGSAGEGQVVTVEMPGGSSASCSLDITPGSRVVIFSGEKEGRFSTSLCQGSHLLTADAPWPDLPPPGGAISGQLMRHATEPRGAPRPVPDVPVWTEASGSRIASTTDPDGKFRLTGVPEGNWIVQFDLGPSELADAKVELRSADDCAVIYVSPRPRGQ